MEPAKPLLSCPNARNRVVVELVSGQVLPDRCRTNGCEYCLPFQARRRALAITLMAPYRMIRLSAMAPSEDADPCSTALTRIGLVRRNLWRRKIDPGLWTWTLEKNPKGTGYHAHCLQIGKYVSQNALQDACLQSHAGQPDIRAIKREGLWTSRYGMKGFGADGYGLKKFRATSDAEEALRMNHHRVEHHSVGFFSTKGSAISPREAERVALAHLNEGKDVAYIGCAPAQAREILTDLALRRSLISDVMRRNDMRLTRSA